MNSRSKGQRGEREWASVLRGRFPGLVFRRGLQSRGGGKEIMDVEGLPGFHCEVKRVEKLNIWQALAQAEDDADAQNIPLVPFRRNRGEWYVALRADDFLDLVADRVLPIGQASTDGGSDDARVRETGL